MYDGGFQHLLWLSPLFVLCVLKFASFAYIVTYFFDVDHAHFVAIDENLIEPKVSSAFFTAKIY